MLTFEQIKELIDQVASHRLSGLEIERSGFRLKIEGQHIVRKEPGAVHLSVPASAEDVPLPASLSFTPSSERWVIEFRERSFR